jgi:hypothetical protein
MPKFTYNGKRAAFPQPISYGKNESGYYSVVPYEGSKKEVEIRAAAYDAIGALYEVRPLYGGRARLEVRLSWLFTQGGQPTEAPVNVWELDPQEVEKDLLSADFPNGLIGEISKQNRSSIRTALETIPADDSLPPAMFADGTEDAAITLYYLMRAGVQSFPIDAHVIRHTQVVSNRYSTQVVYLNEGRILSRDTFIALEGVPPDLLFGVPTEPTPSQFIETSGDLQYGWRKIKPQVQDIAQQKRQIVRSYAFGLWPINIFGDVL